MTFRTGPVTVTVPATSANLGPGFDCLGLALGLRDTLTAEVAEGPVGVHVEGEGAGEVPLDDSHLVVRSMRATFATLGVEAPGIRLRCTNLIPHARGLGSSSAAIVAGIALARALAAERMEDRAALDLATRIEGHPDNVAPALLGGFTVSVVEPTGEVVWTRLPVHPSVRGVVLVPPYPLETARARGLLPAEVPHTVAAANSARTAMLVAALTTHPELLLPATVDALHQEYRRQAMPESLALVDQLRSVGIAAVVSGAGPTVLALTTDEARVADVLARTPTGWTAATPSLGGPGVEVVGGGAEPTG